MSAALNLILKLQDQASAGLQNVTGHVRALGDTAAGAGRAGFGALQGAGRMAVGAIAAGAGVAVMGIGLIGGAAFGVATDVQTATANIQSELGATAEEAERLGAVATAVWGDNFAGSVEEAAGVVVQARQQMGALADEELQRVTSNALRLADAFEVDTAQSLNTANALMESFGLSGEQSFDFITAGMQRGLNASGDFLDSIGEYGHLFAASGFSAEQMFGIMESGAAAGVLGTDKISDAIKEMGIILNEGGEGVSAAFDQIGLDYDALAASVSAGESTWGDHFDAIVGGLNEIEDPLARSRAQVGIFGTMAEDLGVKFTEGLTTATMAMGEMEGATEGLDARYNNLGDTVEAYKRRTLLAIQPIGGALLGLANSALPYVQQGFAIFETNVVPAIETVAGVIASLIANFEEGMSPIDAFIEAVWDIAPPEVLAALTGFRDDILPGLSAAIMSVVEPVMSFVTQNVELKDVLIAVGLAIASVVIPVIVSIVAAIAPVIAVFALVVAAVVLVRTAWESNWGGIQQKTQVVIEFIQSLITTVMTAIKTFWNNNGDAILSKAAEVWAAIQAAIQTAITIVQAVVTSIVTAVKTFWEQNNDGIKTKAETTWTAIQAFVTTAITTIQTVITTIATAIQTFWESHGAMILEAAQNYWTLVTTFIGDAFALLTSVWGLFRAAFEGDWEAFGATLVELWENAWALVINFLTGLWNLVSPLLQGFWTAIQEWFTGIDWPSLGKSIIDGIVSGIINAGAAILDALSEIIRGAIAQILINLGISSPSRVTADVIGKPMAQGVLVGWEETLGRQDMTMAINQLFAPQLTATAATVGGGLTAAPSQQSTLVFDFRGAIISSEDELQRMIDGALARAGVRADVIRRTR